MGDNNTALVLWPPVVNSSYEIIDRDWNTPFNSIPYLGWAPFLDFGDISSLMYADSQIYNPYFAFWDYSCWDGDIQNCTSVCTNATLLFANITVTDNHVKGSGPKLNVTVPYNVLACMYYPVLSKLLGSTHPQNDSWVQLEGISKQYHIVPNASTALIQQMVDTQAYCYAYYCASQTSSFCSTYDTSTGNYQAFVAPGVLPLFPDWSSISPEESMQINPDLGGIGVSISYIMGFSILLSVWFALRYLRLHRRLRKKGVMRSTSEKKAVFPEDSEESPQPEQSTKATLTILAKMQYDLNELLAEYHRAQCLFFIPLNAAGLTGLLGSTSVFGTTSLGQLSRNIGYVQCLTQGSIVSTVTGMYLMLFEDTFHDDTFGADGEETATERSEDTRTLDEPQQLLTLWTLTLISVALGTTVWCLSFNISNPDKFVDATIGSYQVDWTIYCGSISPATYNGEKWNDQWTAKPNKRKRLPVILFGWILLGCMLVYFCRRHVRRAMHKVPHPLRQASDMISPLVKHHWTKRIVLGIVEILLLVCQGVFLHDYITLMRPSLPQINKTFTMGQFLAVFVWAGVILEAYYMLSKWFLDAWHQHSRGQKENANATRLHTSADEN